MAHPSLVLRGARCVAIALAIAVAGRAGAAEAPAPAPAAAPLRSLALPEGALVAPGPAADLELLFTGDVIGFVEPCG